MSVVMLSAALRGDCYRRVCAVQPGASILQ